MLYDLPLQMWLKYVSFLNFFLNFFLFFFSPSTGGVAFAVCLAALAPSVGFSGASEAVEGGALLATEVDVGVI